MKVFVEHLIQQWAYKCENGIIDYNDPKKIKILQSLIENIQEESNRLNHSVTYETVEKEYNAIIKQKFGYIPIPKTTITSLDYLDILILDNDDLEVIQSLYPLKPTTKSGAKNNSGTGKGELALYWLLTHNGFEIKINSKSNSNQPDFCARRIGDKSYIGIEIKSFEYPNINLGRFQKSKDFGDLLEMLNIAYTVSTISEFTDPDNKVSYSALSVNPSQLQQVFFNMLVVRRALQMTSHPRLYDIGLNNAIHRFDTLYEKRSNKSMSPDTDLTLFFISELIKTKLYTKPGLDGYVVNIQPDGSIKSIKITKELIESEQFAEKCIQYAMVNGGSLRINFDKIFGFSK
jgi:hypothetical protein